MRVLLDAKFLLTFLVTLIILVPLIIVLNAVAGPVTAGVVGTVIAGVTVKLFERLDYTPSFSVELGAPRISAAWIYSALASIFILYGCDVPARISRDLLERFGPSGGVCVWWVFLVVVLLDFGGYALAGWIIGRLFPIRALAFTSLAALIFVLAAMAAPDLGVENQRVQRLLGCFVGVPPTPEEMETAQSGVLLGRLFGLIARAYLAIAMARIASRAPREAAGGSGLAGP